MHMQPKVSVLLGIFKLKVHILRTRGHMDTIRRPLDVSNSAQFSR
jgi:hypothetical protein